jgi:hypothetical protein
MTEPKLRLDRGKTFSECHGERTPDDPHYRVVNWQGGKMGGHVILLPFDAQDNLIEDDGKTEPFEGAGLDKNGNPITVKYHPLYSPGMRRYLAAKTARVKAQEEQRAKTSAEDFGLEDEEGADEFSDSLGATPGGGVDLAAWLKGEQRYQPHQIRNAVRDKFHKNVSAQSIPQIVVDLVLDENVVDESALAPQFLKMLPPAESRASV